MGISLSQLIVENPEPLLSGFESLDDALGGFHTRSIYEVFGPPGTCKTDLAIRLLANELARDGSALWIDSHTYTPLGSVSKESSSLKHIRLTKFSQYVFFFQELAEQYSLIVLQGFSKVLTDYLYQQHQHLPQSTARRPESTHMFKVKSLITLFTLMTKYAHTHKSTIILVNDSMNTSFQHHSQDQLVAYNDESSFLLRSQKRNSVQVLRSALVANLGVGTRDQLWEVFLKRRIGLFWDWDWHHLPPRTRVPPATQVALVYDFSQKGENYIRVNLPQTLTAFGRSPDTFHNPAASPTPDATINTTRRPPDCNKDPGHSTKRPRYPSPVPSQSIPLTPRFRGISRPNSAPEPPLDLLYDSQG